MSIRPVDMSGMIQRTQDIGNMKHQEENKPVVEQHNISVHQQKEEENLPHQVQQTGKKEKDGYRYDAREKGSNSYEDNRKKKKKRDEEQDGEPESEGKVFFKGRGSSFDMKI